MKASNTKKTTTGLAVRRIWGETLNLFLLGDLLAAVFLPIWLNFGEDGISGGDAAQLVASCVLLVLLTLCIRAAVWGIGRLADRRVLGRLEACALVWDGRSIALGEIRAFRYRCFPCARLFRQKPSGLWLTLDGGTMFLARAPYWLAAALGHRCPNVVRRPTIGLWILLGGAVLFCLAVTVWLAV